MVFQKYVIFLLSCLAPIYSDAKLEVLQVYINQSTVAACVVVPVSEETFKEPESTTEILTASEFNFSQVNDSSSSSGDMHSNITSNYNLMAEEKMKRKIKDKVSLAKERIVIQYYAKSKGKQGTIFFAGDSQIKHEHLQQGLHELNIQQTTRDLKLALEVRWDGQEVYFQTNMIRPLRSDMYDPYYIEVLGPAQFHIPEDSICDEMLNAMALTSEKSPYQLAVVASSIMGVLVLLSVVALLLARRYCKSDFLPIANHHASPRRIHDNVAGFDQSYSGTDVSEDFQYQPIRS